MVGDVAGESARPCRHRDARDGVEVLDRARHAEQGRQRVGVGRGPQDRLGLAGLREGVLGRERDERAHLRSQRLGAVERVAHDVGGGGLAVADRRGELEGGEVVQLGHAVEPSERRSPPHRPIVHVMATHGTLARRITRA